jgi:hypothetical protein
MGPEKPRPAAGGGARVSGHCASGQPARPQNNLDHQSDQPHVIVVEPVGRRGRFRAKLDGGVLVTSSRTPFCDAARVLLAEGVDPTARILMRHAGAFADALTSTVAGAAKLTIEEGDRVPYFRRWRPLSRAAERRGIAPHQFPATPLAPAESLIGEPTAAVGDLGGGR